MPAALPLVAGALLAAGSVATAVGVTLGVAFTIGAVAVSWGAVLAVTGIALMAVSYLAAKKPKIDSADSQLDLKLDPQASVPVVYGRTATGGVVVDRLSWGKKNIMLGIVAVLSAGGPVQAIESYKAGDYQIGWNRSPATGLAIAQVVGGYGSSSKLYKNKLTQRWQNGDAPAFLTPASTTGYPLNAGALSGLAHAITAFEQNTDAFPQGVPSSLWVVQGVKLYDPRKDSTYPGGSGSHRLATPSTWTFSENPYLAALQWTLGRFENGKRVYGIGAKWAEVDVASFVAGANVADANKWKVGGVVTTTDDKFAVLSTILAAGGGLPVARGAQIGVTYNAPKATVTTLTAADVIGEIEISSTTGNRDRQNTIIPKYREETQGWELITGERVSSSVYVTEDSGETRTVESEFTFCQQAAQAHQLAAYELCNTREFLTFTANVKLRLLAVRVGEAIMVNLPQVAATAVKCMVVGREFDPMTLSVTLSLKSETDAKHPFALGQSQVAPPSPALDTYDPTNPGAPSDNAWAITDTQITTADQKVPVLVVTGAADDPNTAAVIVEYRPVGSTTWLNWGEFARTTTRVEINSVTSGTQYQVAISYRTNLNAIGDRLVMTATAGAIQFAYDKVLTGKPTTLGDINPSEGTKLGSVEDHATNGAPYGTPFGNGTVDGYIRDTQAVHTAHLTNLANNEIARIRDRALSFPGPAGESSYTLHKREETARTTALESVAETFELLGTVTPDGQAFVLDDTSVQTSKTLSGATAYKSVSARFADNEGDIETIQQVFTDEAGTVARALLRVDANGRVIGYAATNDGRRGAFVVTADVFKITDPDTGKDYFFADDTGKVVMRNVEVDTIKVGAVDYSSLQLGAAQKASWFTVASDVSVPQNGNSEVARLSIVKEDRDSILKIQMYCKVKSPDDLQFVGTLMIDGVTVDTTTVNIILDSSTSQGQMPITPIAYVSGIAAGAHTISFKLRNTENDNIALIAQAGSTLEVVELRKASIGSTTGSGGAIPVVDPVTGEQPVGGGSGGGGGYGGGGIRPPQQNQS